jgi:hypothetical protein
VNRKEEYNLRGCEKNRFQATRAYNLLGKDLGVPTSPSASLDLPQYAQIRRAPETPHRAFFPQPVKLENVKLS